MLRRQSDTLRRNEIDEWIMLGRQVLVHRGQDVLVGVRTRHFEHTRMAIENPLRICTEATRDDHLAVLFQRLTDRLEGLIDCRINESTRIDDDEICRVVIGRDRITLCPQLGEDTFRIDQCLGAAEADESDLGVFSGHAIFYRCVAALVRSLDEVSAVLLMTSEAEAEYV